MGAVDERRVSAQQARRAVGVFWRQVGPCFCLSAPCCTLYRPRQPRESPLYWLLDDFYDKVKGSWEDRVEQTYGFWRGRPGADSSMRSCSLSRPVATMKEAWLAELKDLGRRGEYFKSLNRYLFLAGKRAR